jgi:hypothetical protein
VITICAVTLLIKIKSLMLTVPVLLEKVNVPVFVNPDPDTLLIVPVNVD